MQFLKQCRAHNRQNRQPHRLDLYFVLSVVGADFQILFPLVCGGQEDSRFWDLLCWIYFLVTSSCFFFKQVQLQQLKKTSPCSSLLLFCDNVRNLVNTNKCTSLNLAAFRGFKPYMTLWHDPDFWFSFVKSFMDFFYLTLFSYQIKQGSTRGEGCMRPNKNRLWEKDKGCWRWSRLFFSACGEVDGWAAFEARIWHPALVTWFSLPGLKTVGRTCWLHGDWPSSLS